MLNIASAPIDARAFRATMGQFATGVTVVSTTLGDHTHAMTANAFMSVSLDPPLVLVSVGRRARMHDLLALGQPFGINVLAADQASLSDHFAGRGVSDALIVWQSEHGAPVLAGAVAHIVAEVVTIHPAGDHSLFIGHVEYIGQQPGQPLIFHAGAYAHLHDDANVLHLARQSQMFSRAS